VCLGHTGTGNVDLTMIIACKNGDLFSRKRPLREPLNWLLQANLPNSTLPTIAPQCLKGKCSNHTTFLIPVNLPPIEMSIIFGYQVTTVENFTVLGFCCLELPLKTHT
jgi:hypothetical protein